MGSDCEVRGFKQHGLTRSDYIDCIKITETSDPYLAVFFSFLHTGVYICIILYSVCPDYTQVK